MIQDQKKIGVILSYSSELIKILTSIIYTPIMLRLLGQHEYGLYQLVYSVVSYLSLLNLGFGASYLRFYSRFKVKEDEQSIAKLNGTFILIFCTMSIVCFLCGLVMVSNINLIFSTGLSKNEYIIAQILMCFMIINLMLTFPNSVFTSIITAHEKFLFQKLIILLQNLLNPFLTLPLLLLGFGSIGMVLITTILTVSSLILNMYFCFSKLKSKFSFRGLKLSLLKEMWIFTFFIFLNQIIDQINWSVDKFLLGRLTGTVSVAVYGVGAQINTLYLQLSTSISSVFIPKINKIIATNGEDSELTTLFTKVGRIQFIILMLILSGFIFFGKPFISFWAGEVYSDSYYVSVLLICSATIPLIQNLGLEIQKAKNKHKARSIVYFFIAIVNVLISVPLIKISGPIGAATGTTISLLVGNGLFMNWYYQKHIGINILYFWKHIVIFTPAIIIPCLFGILNTIFIHYDNLWKLGGGIISYIIVYCCSMFILGMNKEEKNIILTLFKNPKRL